jgi:hypothetical protein
MPSANPKEPEITPGMVPAGKLQYLLPTEIKPSTHNPRRLFDPTQLLDLKTNISEHGVLVPITVFQGKGHKTFSILDGERRYRCVKELTEEGHLGKDGNPMRLPANVVDPPTRVAGLLILSAQPLQCEHVLGGIAGALAGKPASGGNGGTDS